LIYAKILTKLCNLKVHINMWCAARRESAARSRADDDSADTFPTVTTFLLTIKDRY
jgi:hypothetical protein